MWPVNLKQTLLCVSTCTRSVLKSTLERLQANAPMQARGAHEWKRTVEATTHVSGPIRSGRAVGSVPAAGPISWEEAPLSIDQPETPSPWKPPRRRREGWLEGCCEWGWRHGAGARESAAP